MENVNDYRVGDLVLIGPDEWIKENGGTKRSYSSRLGADRTGVIENQAPDLLGIRFNDGSYSGVEIKHILGHAFKWGQEIKVSDDGIRWYEPKKFVGYAPGKRFPVLVTDDTGSSYKYARPIRKPAILELTLDQIAEKFNVPVETIKVKK
jgi:hypothetical protein